MKTKVIIGEYPEGYLNGPTRGRSYCSFIPQSTEMILEFL